MAESSIDIGVSLEQNYNVSIRYKMSHCVVLRLEGQKGNVLWAANFVSTI